MLRCRVRRIVPRVRVLVSCLPSMGHFNPIVALARALSRAGHDVAVATAAELGRRVEAAGFEFHPTGIGMMEQIETARNQYPRASAIEDGRQRFEEFVPRMLAGVAAPARARDLIPLVERWKPNVIVHDEAELAGPLAAKVAGVPWASNSVVLRRPLSMAHLSAEIIAPLAERHHVDLHDMAGLYRFLHFDACPPSLQPPGSPVIATAHLMRNTEAQDTVDGDELPAWVAGLRQQPTIYLTLGTLFNRNRDVWIKLLRGFATESVNVIATVGAENLAALQPQAENIHLASYIPLTLLLPHLHVVVTNGGTSILPALGAGLPLLLVPQGADQFHNADACVAAGVGLALQPHEVSPVAVASAARRLLSDDRYAIAASVVASEIAAMPGPEHGVALLERLAAGPRETLDSRNR